MRDVIAINLHILQPILSLADSVAPPGIPGWLWLLMGGVAMLVLTKALPLLWNAAKWVQKHEKPQEAAVEKDPHELLRLHMEHDSERFQAIQNYLEQERKERRDGYNEDQAFRAELRGTMSWLRERVSRLEAFVDPHGAPRDPTGAHGTVKIVK